MPVVTPSAAAPPPWMAATGRAPVFIPNRPHISGSAQAQLAGESRPTPSLCRSVGFIPTLYRGTVDSILASVDLVADQRCVMCAPASCLPAPSGIVWRPLVAPLSRYPWSVLWRAGDSSEHVSLLVDTARTLSAQLGWLQSVAMG